MSKWPQACRFGSATLAVFYRCVARFVHFRRPPTRSRSRTRWGLHMPARDRNILLCAILGLVITAGGAQAQTTLRLGYGAAAEEPLWLLLAKPDLVKNYGKTYTLEGTRFTGSDKRAQ